ncbi:NUDIX hydrolase domain-like protein [Rhizophagus irregularis DAOM 181602=DAOM 197198]|uniref:NUDIX hydrolase domain-like protein n=1 Tax=Rhizophagus irregularis (strain DAOM 181602 / DAOM 197198 / MUCL 43194) TaxID=747089 RepID=A0A2P4QWD5_RHIID|nr:NUDIX hydrolase domain-like protein [Rhizophagus irregularis DAOM 181602=DAOM 197198]POG81902.1 NUDIX hydrolase domain-like protein [Rhizophagus irregularis DAOM 181602=DAOM 197198]|eukprot:XP_025188768.1 NUDIX hydrolase domain-like protein [Rhizophagus irregularis DAOM 181602=DAOM 197198]
MSLSSTPNYSCKHPRVGVGVFVIRGNKFLVGKRKGSHGAGTWEIPGGHLEFGETFSDCAKREILEETNLEIKNIKYQTVTNEIMHNENKHYVSIYMKAEVVDENVEPAHKLIMKACIKVMEPNKTECLEWVTWSEFIKGGITGILEDKSVNKYRPMFQPMETLITEQPEYNPV